MKQSHTKQSSFADAAIMTPPSVQQRWEWESLQDLAPELEPGECLYLLHDTGPVIGVIFQDTEADEERWEARLLANGTCSSNTHHSDQQAKRWVETRITRFLRKWEEHWLPPTPQEHRSGMENILVFLLASIEADEQILTVTEYHKLWVAICYNTETGFIQDYTMKYDSEGSPYCSVAEDFSGQYATSFRPRRKGNRRTSAPGNNQHEAGGKDTL